MTLRLHAEDFDSAYREVVAELLKADVIESRAGPCREIIGGSICVEDPSTFCWSRKASPIYAAGELIWYLTFTDDGEQISHYSALYQQFLEPDKSGRLRAYGAYGLRWKEQMEPLLARLRQPNTRQAVLTAWREDDLRVFSKDVPCTVSLQFLPRKGKLHCVVSMRSNDVWLGMPYDTYCFSRLQSLIAMELGLELGFYTHTVGSLHLYEKNARKAELMLRGHKPFVEDDVPYEKIQLPMLEACRRASILEEMIRKNTCSISDVEEMVDEAELYGTELGACVALCWMRANGVADTDLVRERVLNQIRKENAS